MANIIISIGFFSVHISMYMNSYYSINLLLMLKFFVQRLLLIFLVYALCYWVMQILKHQYLKFYM